MKRKSVIIILLTGLVAWQCSKIDNVKPDLKQSLMSNVNDLNAAVNKISTSKGYQLLTINGSGTAMGLSTGTVPEVKSIEEGTISDSIKLADVAGIYEFQPDFSHFWHHYFPVSLFKKTGESPHMIVHMPRRMMFKPRYLYNVTGPDSSLKNNFTIDASVYHLYLNGWSSFDYKLGAGFAVNDTTIGSSDISAMTNSGGANSFKSQFTFPEGYKITFEKSAVDTARSSSFTLADNANKILLKESSALTKTGYKMFERQYILSIGNIEIKRSTGIDSIQVWVDGILQKKAAVKISDENENDENKSVFIGRDLQITFDDGTTTKLSDLINPAVVTLRSLENALGEMYFARNIVDYIALSIKYSAH